MASNDLLELSYRRPNFNDGLKTKKISDIKKTTSDTFKTKERYFIQDNELLSGSTSMGSTHTFSIKRSEGFVGNFRLYMTLAGSTTTGQLVHAAAIDEIDVIIGSSVMKYSGLTLWHFLNTINNDATAKTELAAWAGGAAKTTTAAGLGIVPIVAPGSNGLYKTYSDMGENPMFPIGKCNTDMVIRVTLKAITDLETTTAMTLTSLYLKYYSAKIKDDIGISTTKGGKQVVYSYNYVHFQDQTLTKVQVSGTEYAYDLSSIIINGDLQFVGCTQTIDAEYSTAKDHFDTQEIAALRMVLKGTHNIYKHTSTLEARDKHLKYFKGTNVFGQTSTYFYNIPISANFAWVVNKPGSSGCNLNLESPLLYITAPASDTVRLHTFAVFKCIYQVYSDKTVKEITVFE